MMGLPLNFNKFFWKDLGIFFVRSLNYGFSIGNLSVTQNQGEFSILNSPQEPRVGDLFLFSTFPIKLLLLVKQIEFKICVLQNGIFSKFFFPQEKAVVKGIKFPHIICIKMMGLMIRQNKNIKGIKIEKETICSLQYADGTVPFLDDSEKSLQTALDLLF